MCRTRRVNPVRRSCSVSGPAAVEHCGYGMLTNLGTVDCSANVVRVRTGDTPFVQVVAVYNDVKLDNQVQSS